MFIYCGDNPVNRVDPAGGFWDFIGTVFSEIGKAFGQAASAYQGGAIAAATDGLFPFGDFIGLVIAGSATAWAVGVGIVQGVKTHIASNSKEEEKEDEKPISRLTPTVIYRYYASKNKNLWPRQGKDYDGLSFSTKPPRPGVSAVVTTIEEVNATGILAAIPTGGEHIIIVPTNGTVSQWMQRGQFSTWSQTLSLIVVEWEGGG